MKILVKENGAGKTHEAILYAAQFPKVYIVVRDTKHAAVVSEMARRLGADINFPITYHELLHNHYNGMAIEGFIIDDADDLLKSITKNEIKMITMTTPIEKVRKRKDGCWNCKSWCEANSEKIAEHKRFKIGVCKAEAFDVRSIESDEFGLLCGHDSTIYYGENYYCKTHEVRDV